MDPQLREMMKQSIHLASPLSASNSGVITYTSPAPKLARVEEERRVVQVAPGQEVMSTHRIFVDDLVNPDDRVWLPGVDETDSTLARQVLQVHPIPDEHGFIHHYEVVV